MNFKLFRVPLLWALLTFCGLVVCGADVDNDGDGMTASEEAAAGTSDSNPLDVRWASLGSWRFSNSTFIGDNGQQPIGQVNVSITPSGFDGPGVSIPGSGSAMLKYRAVEPSGKPNIAPIRGTIYFRFKPKWHTGNSAGPGAWVTVLQTTNWVVQFNPTGSQIVLFSLTGGVKSVLCQVDDINIGNFGEFWSYGLITYSPDATSIEFDAPSTRSVGAGIFPPANLNDPNGFLSIGSSADGSSPVNGYIDEVVAFNATGKLDLTPWTVSATASSAPAGLNLVWTGPTNAILEVKRRLVGNTAWETTRGAFGTSFFDSTVVPGQRYEYNINSRILSVTTGLPDDFGTYLKASLNGTPLHNPGKIILLVDQTLTNGIQTELSGFITNLIGDGWQVLRLDVPRHIDAFASTTAFVTNYFFMTNMIKPFVNSNYALFGSEIKYVLAIGHVPVAYTGTIADDGHNDPAGAHGSHAGAWASDLFYGDVDGIWTDVGTLTNSTYLFNWNVPGDGRLDQDMIPNNAGGLHNLEMGVARMDLSFLVSVPDTEANLMKRYFTKNANYRKGITTFSAQGIYAEFILSGRVAEQLTREALSKASVLQQPFNGDVFADSRSFLFGVQSGAGYFDRINDSQPAQHTTGQVGSGQTATNCAFYFLRGSYFPDFNSQDNFLRAPLAMPNGGLATIGFIGSAGWRVTGLGVGQSIGSEMAAVASDWTTPGNVQSVRSIELMGDPTLRYPVLAPASGLSWKVTNNAVSLTWSAAPAASGYYVYRSTDGINASFDQITTTPVSGLSYTDSAVPSGNIMYMVRAAATATSGAGTFTNLSQGIFSRPITSADPVNCCFGTPTINEDAVFSAAFSIGEAGNETGLTIATNSSNPALVPNGNIVLGGAGSNRTLDVTPLANQFGTTVITITAHTDLSTVVRVFTLTVASVNDIPVFTQGPDIAIGQGSGAQSFNGWATGISAGPSNESGQQLTFVVTNDSPHLFSVQPAISTAGKLTFTPVPAERGNALVSVQIKDSGGTANGGTDISYVHTFNVTLGLPQDTDGDGLPDDFEQFYGFKANSPGDDAGDWDGDGMTNLQEFTAGTDPKDSRSSLRINSAASQSPTFAVQFNSVAGKSYSFELNDSFPNNSWQVISSPIIGTGAPIEQLDTDAGNSARRIYRITTADGDLATEYAGLARLTLPGNSDTYLSIPFLRPAADLAAVVSVSGNNNVKVRGPANWQVAQWAYAGGSQSNTYFMLIRSGALQGEAYTITGNNADTVAVDLQGDSLANLQPGDAVAIVPYWTLGTLFHGGVGVNPSPSPANRQTEVLFPNLGASGIDASSDATYYFSNGAWRQVGQGSAIKNDEAILPDMYLIVRNNVGSGTTLTTEGAVIAGQIRLHVHRTGGSKQDNPLALARPNSVSLFAAGLVNLNDLSGGAFRESPSSASKIDELMVFDNAATAKNKSAIASYYFSGGFWRKLGAPATDAGGDVVFVPGTGVIVRSGTANNDAVWLNVPDY